MPILRSDSSFRDARHLALVILAAVLVSAISVGSAAALAPTERRFTNARLGVTVEAPAGWTFSQHTGYADTLVLAVHPDGSRISVTVASTTAKTAADLFKQSPRGFVAQGLAPSTLGEGARGSFAVDLVAQRHPDRLRQLYLVRQVPKGYQAIVLTLVCRGGAFVARTPALDFVATRLTFDDPFPPSNPAISTRAVGQAGSGGQAGR